MNIQLNLLDLPPIEEEPPTEQAIAPVATLPLEPPNPHLMDWHQRRADLYLQLMGRIQQGRLSVEAKRHEINRLHQLRQQAIATLNQLGGTTP